MVFKFREVSPGHFEFFNPFHAFLFGKLHGKVLHGLEKLIAFVLDEYVSQRRAFMKEGSDVGVIAGLPPSDAYHDSVESVFSKHRRSIRGVAQDAVGRAPDGLFEFAQLFQWSKVEKPARPAVPELLQLGAKRGML